MLAFGINALILVALAIHGDRVQDRKICMNILSMLLTYSSQPKPLCLLRELQYVWATLDQ